MTTSARARRMYSGARTGIPRPHDSRETPASASRNAFRTSIPAGFSTDPCRAVRIATIEASSPNSRVNSDRCSSRSRANSRPTLPKPTRTIRCRIRSASEVEPFPCAPPKGGAHDEFRNGGVLDAHTGQVCDGDFLVRSPTPLQPGGDLAELGVDVPAAEDPGLDGVMNLSEPDALVESVRDDLVGVLEHSGLELLFVRTVGADGRDVSPRGDPFGSDERLPRWRHRDQDVRAANRLLDRLRREHPDAVELLHVLREVSRFRFGSAERDYPFRRPHSEEGAKLITGLGSDTDDPDSIDFVAREEFRRQRARGPRPQVREVAVVE